MRPALAKRLILILVLAAAVAAFFLLGLHRHLTLSAIKASQARFAALYAAHPALTLAAFAALYLAVTGLSLPGATVLTLAGGALLGFWPGLVAVSFASSLGATLACLLARFLFRDAVQRRFGQRLTRINQGMEREGAFYLFTLRLVPVFPFFLINLAMGLTPIRLATFYWVSQLGMLPGTVVYVNAGTHLGRIEDPADILSWRRLLSFALLGLFPLAAKKAVTLIRKHLINHTPEAP